MLDELKKINSSKEELRKFGYTVGIVFALIGLLLLWKDKATDIYFLGIGTALIIFGAILPTALKPIQKVWMAFAVIMGWIMTRIILSILFYLIFTPMALFFKLTGKDLLNEKIDKNANSYWISVKDRVRKKEDYEKQF